MIKLIICNFKETYQEDVKRFDKFYRKKFPNLRIFIAKLQTISFLSIFLVVTYCKLNKNYYDNNFTIIAILLPLVIIYLNCMIVDFCISMYVISYANSPITWVKVQQASQITSTGIKIGVGVVGNSVTAMGQIIGGTISPYINFVGVEPSPLSNWWNTLPINRGWDYEIGNYSLKLKGIVVQGILGNELMKDGIDRVSPDNPILTPALLSDLLRDPKCAPVIWNRGSFAELISIRPAFLGMWGLFLKPQEEIFVNPVQPLQFGNPRTIVWHTHLLSSPANEAIQLSKSTLAQSLLYLKYLDWSRDIEYSTLYYIFIHVYGLPPHLFLTTCPELWWVFYL